MKKSTLLFIIVIVVFFSLLSLWGAYSQLQIDEKRSVDAGHCVELKIFPTQGDTTYQVRFEDEFFCPTQPYTVLEALERAESVLNTRGKPLKIILNNTSNGVVLESMLDKTNTATHTWELEINGNEKVTKPLDKVILQGRSFINFYYR